MSGLATTGAPITAPRDDLGELDLRGLLAGSKLLVMGGTGFLGKVWLSMLLHRFPEVQHVYLVVRPRKRKDGSIRLTSQERFWSEIATSKVFDPVRAQYPGAAYEAFIKEKVTPIPGDVSEAYAGIPDDVRDTLRGQVTALVNSAGVVDFNPPLDYALNANAFGMQNLVSLCRDLGDIRFLHISTCYVAGDRTGEVFEVDPRDYPFPKANELDVAHWDPDREVAECVDMVEHVRHRAADAFRQSEFLDQAKQNLIDKGEPARGSALAGELVDVKRKFEKKRLMAGGTERAKFWGWHNTYTYTKSIGEQILCASGLPFTIVRPAVIESAVDFPVTGWAEGINTSAPLIYLCIKSPGTVPTTDDSVLDIIPVDMVAGGMMVALGELLEGTQQVVYQLGSSDTSPCNVKRMIELVGLEKRRFLLEEAGGNPLVNYLHARLEPTPTTNEQYLSKGPWYLSGLAKKAAKGLRSIGGPLKPLTGPMAKGLEGASRGLSFRGFIIDQFLPFLATHNYRFSCANTRAAHARLPEDMRELVPWAPETIDWRDYFINVHIKGLTENVWPEIEAKVDVPVKALRTHDSLLDFLDEIAERHDLAPAMLRAHEDGFSRVSFRELRERSRAAGARLVSVGVQPGDRVIISGLNHPDWAIAYFGVLWAGGLAVPVDPALSPAQVANIAQTAEVRAAILDEEARGAFGSALEEQVIDLHDVAAEGSDEGLPDHRPSPDDVASVLFTSGTTGTPKGVMLSHGNFCNMLGSLGTIFKLRDTDRVLSVLPLHHTFEFSCGLLLPLSRGARIIYLDEINGERLSYGLQEGRVTGMVGVPALWQLLERRIRTQVEEKGSFFETAVDLGMDLNRSLGKATGLDVGRLFFGSVHNRLGGNIRFLISGGASLPADTQDMFSGLGLHLAEGYGLTEAAPVLTVAKGFPGAKAGHVGKPVPGVELRIDKADKDGVGEVQARGPNVMQGYFNNAEATQAALDDDGWLHTGDLGRIDHKGRLSIVGRAKDVVVTSSGENVYLDDVEAQLGRVKHVKELSLVGVPDARGGERLALLAVPDDEEKLDRATLHSRAREALRDAVEKLPKSQRPTVVHLVDADLPKTATRKVKRQDVKQVLEKIIAASSETIQERGEGVNKQVARAIAAVAGVNADKVNANTRMDDELGFDSLMWVELAAGLESASGSRPDADELSRCQTVAQVVTLVNAPAPEIVQEEDARDSVKIPGVVAKPLKDALGFLQREAYGTGLSTKVIGQAYIPQNRQTIVVSNHCSHLDMGLVKYALGPYGRNLVALAAQDYFFEGGKWWVAYFEQLTNLRPIDRKRGFRASLNQANEVVKGGNVVLLFPEGTRRTDGIIGEFKPLVGRISLDTGVDILPMHLDGTFESLPKGAVLPRNRSVTVRIGPPLRSEDMLRLTKGMKNSTAARTVAHLAQSAVEALRDGDVLDISTLEAKSTAPPEPKRARHEVAFEGLAQRLDTSRVKKPVTWYFSLGGKTGPRYTVSVTAEGADVTLGRPPGGAADCVVKSSADLISRIILDGYVPEPPEFMAGNIKTNDIPTLIEFSRVFKLTETSGQEVS